MTGHVADDLCAIRSELMLVRAAISAKVESRLTIIDDEALEGAVVILLRAIRRLGELSDVVAEREA